MIIHLEEGGLFLDISARKGSPAELINFSAHKLNDPDDGKNIRRRLVEVHIVGGNLDTHHARKHNGSSLGGKLSYVSHEISEEASGRRLTLLQECDGITVESEYSLYKDIPCVRCRSRITNNSSEEIVLEYISSFCMYAVPIENWENNAKVFIPHNSWTNECSWREFPLSELGLTQSGDFTLKRVACENVGSWSTAEYLPMGILKDSCAGNTYFWQIEHNGSWEWEIGDYEKSLYLLLFGPTGEQGAFYKRLCPGESFESVPAAVGAVIGDEETAMQQLTRYRRVIRRRDTDNKALPVVFNDFIAFSSSPSAEKEYPLIDAAAAAGCEIYCIDAGWYDTGDWWDKVGEWQVCRERFPDGLKCVTDYIKQKGMIPGIWLEPEVMGTACPSAEKLPDDWFFCRYGKRVIDNRRYLLDFRNPNVRDYINNVIDGLIRDYGIGYFKLDYNVDAGVGTEINADSFGDGLLGHNRALLNWARELFERHPGLIVESCASGGCRMDYGMLSIYSMQSVSDQSDYRKVARIISMSATAITPEQAGIWSAPKDPENKEAAAFHMINTLLARIHQSGRINELSDGVFATVKNGIEVYKNTIRNNLPDMLPIWPLGFADANAENLCYGLIKNNSKTGYLAVWHLTGERTLTVPLKKYGVTDISLLYPTELPYSFSFSSGKLNLNFPADYTARLFKFKLNNAIC